MKRHNSGMMKAGGLCAALLMTFSALGQTAASGLGACAAIAEDSARLVCYDALARATHDDARASGNLSEARPAVAPAIAAANRAAPAATAEAAVPARANLASTAEESFGETQSRSAGAVAEEAALVATIAAIDEVEPKKWQITLANGQVWKQSIGKSFLLRENDAVRITRSPWGGTWRLQKPGKPGYIQVQRQR